MSKKAEEALGYITTQYHQVLDLTESLEAERDRLERALHYIASWPTWGWDFNARARDIRSYAQAILAGADPLAATQKSSASHGGKSC